MQYQLLIVLLPLVLCQSEDETAFHFSDLPHGRIVWIIESTNLPWTGEYKYLKSRTVLQAVLLTVVDSSSGITLGECTDFADNDIPLRNGTWRPVHWVLTPNSLLCTVSEKNSSRVIFPLSARPRTFSVRLQSMNGPACVRDMQVQNERAVGCPPHFYENSFSSNHLRCGCPFDYQNYGGSQTSRNPHFPLFELASMASPPPSETLWTVSPCAEFLCQNNGTCVVTQEGSAACLCRNGFIGANCEVDVCSTVPCQNGGSCRANGGEAFCDCRPPFTGILCESVAATCEPACENGECVVRGDKVTCECRQGFTGSACNVVDVCLGNTACTMFSEEAKCIVDETNLTPISSSLFNATYECRCPHPGDGEYVDCLALHLSTSVSESIPTMTPVVPLSITRVQVTTRKVQETTTLLPSRPASTTERHVTSPINTTLVHRPVEMNTSVTASSSTSTISERRFTTESPTVWTNHSLNTKTGTFHCCKHQTCTVLCAANGSISAQTGVQNGNHSHVFMPSTVLSTSRGTTPISSFPDHDMTELLSTKELLTSKSEILSAQLMTTAVYELTSSFTSATPENSTLLFNHLLDLDSKPTTHLPDTTYQTTMPLWTTETEPSFLEASEIATVVESSFEASTSIAVKESERNEVLTANVTKTAVIDVGSQSSSAVSWIVAIVAIIVLALLLLATSLFVLRYVKQSRKLHGKYNPAREEHALSTAFSMPMSHMSKDERLI